MNGPEDESAPHSLQHPSPSRHLDLASVFPGDSEMSQRMRAFDWTSTPLGSVETWPPLLQFAVPTMLRSTLAVDILWGPELIQLYNDAYTRLAGLKHPRALGRSTRDAWGEVWHIDQPVLASVFESGQAVLVDDQCCPITRAGTIEETYFTLAFVPLTDTENTVRGVMVTCLETTRPIVAERRLWLLHRLGACSTTVTADALDSSLVSALGTDPYDVPFAALYRRQDGSGLTLSAAVGIDGESPWIPPSLTSTTCEPWNVIESRGRAGALVQQNLAIETSPSPTAPLQAGPVTRAAVRTLRSSAKTELGLLVVGINPARPFDGLHEQFIEFVATLVEQKVNGQHTLLQMRENADIELQRSQQAFKSLAEHSADIIARLDRDLRLLYLSPAARPYLSGVSPEGCIGRRPDEIDFPQGLGTRWIPLIREAFETGQEQRGDFKLPTTPEPRFIEMRIVPESTPDGTVESVMASMRDITDRKRAERAFEQHRIKLERLVKERTRLLQDAVNSLETSNVSLAEAKRAAEIANLAKNEFLSRMSHELRTPLNAVIGFSQLLLERTCTPEEVPTFATHIFKAGEHLLRLIDEVLDISRIESGRLQVHLEDVSLRALLDDVMQMSQPLAARAGITLETVAQGSCEKRVTADAQRLKQILLNLISNAVKYNTPHGRVYLYCQESDHQTRLFVHDTGPGIPPEGQQQLFQPFERLGAEVRRIEGTGLGLWLSKALAEAMGGTLGFQSQPGEGSRFWVELPNAEPAHEMIAEQPSPHATQSSEQPSPTDVVLYVENNVLSVLLVEQMLRNRPDIRLVAAMQGSIALELASTTDLSLIVVDLDLPDTSALDVLAKLRASHRTANVPVLIVTTDPDRHGCTALKAAGAYGFVQKPFDVRAFTAAIDAALETSTRQRARPRPTDSG